MCKENGSSVTQIGVNANELSQLGVQVLYWIPRINVGVTLYFNVQYK